MKKAFVLLILFFAVNSVSAQQKDRISFGTDLGIGIPMSDPSYTPLEWQISGNYHFAKKWSAGIGTGLSFYEKMLVPVFADINYQITRKYKLIPSLSCAVGYSFAPNKNANGGFYLNPSVDLLYPINQQMKLKFSLGYELQELERLKKHSNKHIQTEFQEDLSHHSIMIRVGIVL